MKKKVSVDIIAIVLLLTFMIIFFPLQAVRNHMVREEKKENGLYIEKAIIGKTFSGNRREYSTRGGDGLRLAEFTDTDILCEFRQDGMAYIRTTESYCNGIATVIDGEIAYNDSYTKEKEYSIGEVSVTDSGLYMIKLGGEKYRVMVKGEREPIAIVIDGVTCDLVS